MTKESLAAAINGREYTNEITKLEAKEAKQAGLVVIFGASDDLVELEGAIYDEVGACGGTEFFIGKDGNLLPDIDDDEMVTLKKHGALKAIEARREAATKIIAKWAVGGYSWMIDSAAPHATFDVMEDGEKFCRGIVIDLKEME